MPSDEVIYGPLTADDLIVRALEIANNPNLTLQAQDYLNLCIQQLYRRHDWDFALKMATFQTAYTYPLPTDFLRVADWTFVYNGLIMSMDKIHLTTYDEIPIQNLITSPLPFEGSIDVLNGNLIVFPSLTAPLTFNLRYYYTPAPMTDFAQIPPFPHQSLLLKMLVAWAMNYMDDDRAIGWQQQVDKELSDVLRLSESMEDVPYRLKLGRNFGQGGPVRKSKVTGGFT